MTTNDHPAHGPVSLDRLHQIREILSKAAAQSDGGNLGYAMADAVKVIDGAIAAFGAAPVGEVSEQRDGLVMDGTVDLGGNSTHRIIKGASKMKRLPIGTKFYITPQAPEPMKDHQIRELVNELRDIAIEYHGTHQLRERIARTVRAAMQSFGNSEQLDEAGSWNNHMNTPTARAGNSPVTPDGWIPLSERMPEVGVKVLCFPVEDEPIHAVFNGQLWLQDVSWSNSDEPIDNAITCNVTHWIPLPAAPHQEVK